MATDAESIYGNMNKQSYFSLPTHPRGRPGLATVRKCPSPSSGARLHLSLATSTLWPVPWALSERTCPSLPPIKTEIGAGLRFG